MYRYTLPNASTPLRLEKRPLAIIKGAFSRRPALARERKESGLLMYDGTEFVDVA
jgi:hypothetical protein